MTGEVRRMSPEEILASLEPPGAGLPWYALACTRGLLAPLVARRVSWRRCERAFADEDARVRQAVAGLTGAVLTTRVLVPRLMGLEDSSRYWSLAMTLRHLVIVGERITEVIVRLSRGEAIGERVDFAAVKPEEAHDGAAALAAYTRFADGASVRLSTEVRRRDAPGSVPHPWFGALDARGWFWLLGFHTWVHLRQTRAILERLP
jgi:hypothetical protein